MLDWFRLAALWGCTVNEAIERCSDQEFLWWRAYYRLEPWGQRRAEVVAGYAAACGVAAHTGVFDAEACVPFTMQEAADERREREQNSTEVVEIRKRIKAMGDGSKCNAR